jgi:hypothetical protein
MMTEEIVIYLISNYIYRLDRSEHSMGRHKRKSAQKHSLCSVCCSPDQSSTSISRCSSCLVVHRRTVCASCLNRHIVTILSQDITNSVICPEQGCNAKLTHNTIKSVLLAFNHNVLWEEYLVKSNWSGTSEQWIKRFTARCPGCRVPIEKNGGCTQVVCRQCHLAFNWELAKNSKLYNIRTRWRTPLSLGRAFFYLCLTVIFVLLLTKLLLHKEKLMSMMGNLSMPPTTKLLNFHRDL